VSPCAYGGSADLLKRAMPCLCLHDPAVATGQLNISCVPGTEYLPRGISFLMIASQCRGGAPCLRAVGVKVGFRKTHSSSVGFREGSAGPFSLSYREKPT
jgi:hypothetical protein